MGAGASYGATNKKKKSPPGGELLAQLLCDHVGVKFNPALDTLASVAAYSRKKLGDAAYYSFLEGHYRGCMPSQEQNILANYAWKRIYTTNIDDSMETALGRKSRQAVRLINRNTPIVDVVGHSDEVQLIKLNGNVCLLEAGVIFSTDEYAKEANRIGTWYEELARDYGKYTFVFIGTKLDEPLFYHHVQRLAEATGYRSGQSYIVCPGFSDIQRDNLQDRNIICWEAKISDFVAFISSALGDSYGVKDVLSYNTPSYFSLFSSRGERDLADLLAEAQAITPVERLMLARTTPKHKGGLRNFYYGNAPVWRDVLDGVPAELDVLGKVIDAMAGASRFIVIKGAAGCGKSTLMMQAALLASKAGKRSFYVNPHERFPRKALTVLGSDSVETIVFVDDFEWCHEPIKDMLSGNETGHLRFVVSERANSWARVDQSFKGLDVYPVNIDRISKTDAKKIIGKLREFGPWARLSKMSEVAQIAEIYEKSSKQLLVGLKEATQGVGFEEIIKDEYVRVVGERERLAFHICAVATMHRLRVTYGTFDAVMQSAFGELRRARNENLEEILLDDGGGLMLRHAVIADYLVRNVINKEHLKVAVDVLLDALARFESPLRNNASNAEYQLYSAITNHKFMKSVFKSSMSLSVYKRHEKSFEADGLYWLQYSTLEYGLGRDYHADALNHIRLAMQAYPGSFQIQHAFANMHFGLAANASSREEATSLMETATRILEDQIADRNNDYYPITAIARGRIKVYRKWLPEQLRMEAKRLVERLRSAQKLAPLNDVLHRVIYEVSILASVQDELALLE